MIDDNLEGSRYDLMYIPIICLHELRKTVNMEDFSQDRQVLATV
jgi:hypothetical protein